MPLYAAIRFSKVRKKLYVIFAKKSWSVYLIDWNSYTQIRFNTCCFA
jgi:hypothetical protein